MAYTLNSAKDSQGNEDQVLADFIAHQPAIERYKQQHGGDLEGAYQAVTGKAWPAGRSVKLHNGRAEMTKDRTVKSVLGKYVLPAVAAVAAPYALGALAGGGGAAAGAAGGATASGTGATLASGAGAGTSIWRSLAGPLISAGTNVVGAKLASNANSEANRLSAETSDKELAQAKAIFEAQRADELAQQAEERRRYELGRTDAAPYRAIGSGALSALGQGTGINLDAYRSIDPPAAPLPTVPTNLAGQSTQSAPNAFSAPTLSSMTNGSNVTPASPSQSQAGFSRIQAPNGKIYNVPAAQVQEALQNGGRMAA